LKRIVHIEYYLKIILVLSFNNILCQEGWKAGNKGRR